MDVIMRYKNHLVLGKTRTHCNVAILICHRIAVQRDFILKSG